MDHHFDTGIAPDLAPNKVLWTEHFPGGGHWSYRLRRGTTLRFIDLEGGANVSVLLYRADEKLERLNLPDTLKAQHTAHLTTGHVLYSDMGRILASIPNDTVGWHDPLCGVSDAELVQTRYGQHRYQEHRNGMYRNGKDSLLIELGKWGLGLRDWVPNVNLFSKVGVDAEGPVSPDAIFRQCIEGRYDAVLAMYHDQGLIPVKYLGVEQGVNVTLGLPLVRTSPDHGTAMDLAGKGQADASSMIEAIRMARQMVSGTH